MMESMTASSASGVATHREEGVAARDGQTNLVVCVHSYDGDQGADDGDTSFGMLMTREVVAAPVDQGADFHPRAVDVVTATLPLDGASQVERIPASRVNVVVPEGFGPAVAFVTLAQPVGHQPHLPDVSEQQLSAAVRESGGLWLAVARLGVGITELERSPAQVLQQAGGVTATPKMRNISTSIPEAKGPLPVDAHSGPSVQWWCDVFPESPRCQ